MHTIAALLIYSADSELERTVDPHHDRIGKANIFHKYYSNQNPHFILHDSMGFEPGSTEKSEIIMSFLLNPSSLAERNAVLPKRLNAIL